MSYRDLGDIDNRIIGTVIHMGAERGVENVSSKKIAALCGISNATIFNRFTTMRALIDKAAQRFDRPHMENVMHMAEQGLNAGQIWDKMLTLFLADPDGTLYYISYTNTYGFDLTAKNPRAPEFLYVAKIFFRSARVIADDEYLALWDYITSMAFYYAEKFIHGYMHYNNDTLTFVKKIVFAGVDGILRAEDAGQ